MRLKRLTVECFRGFAQKREFELDSPFVLLTGANGRGKTSFFDAIEWAFLGKLHRLRGSRDSQGTDYISNAFAGAGTEPKVDLVADVNGTELMVSRRGTSGVLEITRGQNRYTGEDAERELNSALLRTPLNNGELYRHLTRTHLLEQDTLLDFLRADKPGQRFEMMSRFLGLGVIRERIEALRAAERDCTREASESAKRLRSAKLNADEATTKLDTARGEVLGQTDIKEQPALLARSQEWVRKAANVTGSALRVPVDTKSVKGDSTDAIAALDVKIKAWTEAKATLKAILERSSDWETLQAQHAAYDQHLQQARETSSQFTIRMREAQDALVKANETVTQWKSRVRNIKGEQADVAGFYDTGKKLAQARETCPLCGRPVAYEALELHVNAELEKLSEEAIQLNQQLTQAEKSLTTAQETVEDVSRQQRELTSRVANLLANVSTSAFKQLTAELERLGVLVTDPSGLTAAIDAKIAASADAVAAANEARVQLVQIEAAADAASRSLLVKELQSQHNRSGHALKLVQAEHDKVQVASERLDTLYHSTRAVERDLVIELLGKYEEVWQDFYYRLQPHPFFTHLKLKLHDGDNQELYFEAHPDGGGQAKRANMIFSGGQSAGLMVVLFLTLHLYQNWSNLETIMLDDPLQSMDDVNVLGLIDLLRFFGDHRQVIFSTHDDRFATMLLHKFRPMEAGRPLYHYEFEGLTRLGPVIEKRSYAPRVLARESMYLKRTH